VSISYNAFSSGLGALVSLPKLVELHAAHNAFSSGLEELLKDKTSNALFRLDLSSNKFSGLFPLEIFPTTERPLLLDISGNVFTCPYPLQGASVIITKDKCRYDWPYFGKVTGIFIAILAFGALLYWLLIHPPSLRARKAIFAGKWVIRMIGLGAQIAFYISIFVFLSTPSNSCSVVNRRAVFLPQLAYDYTDLLDGNFTTFAEYMAELYESFIGKYEAEGNENLNSFISFCHEVGPCVFDTATTSCLSTADFTKSSFFAAVVAAVVVLGVKELLRMAVVLYACIRGCFPNANSVLFASHSPVLPFIYLRHDTLSALERTAFGESFSPFVLLLEFFIEGVCGSLLNLAVNLYYVTEVLQTDLDWQGFISLFFTSVFMLGQLAQIATQQIKNHRAARPSTGTERTDAPLAEDASLSTYTVMKEAAQKPVAEIEVPTL
jgi:hypothetical protein